MIRESVQNLVNRGNITAEEYYQFARFRNFSEKEWKLVIASLSFEALKIAVNEALKNARPVVKAFSSVAPIIETWAPELIRRIEQQLDENERSVLVREMQKEIEELSEQLKYVEETVSALETIEMLGDNKKNVTGSGSLFDRIRKLAGHR